MVQVVREAEVGPAPGDGGVAAERVVRDVEAVVVPLGDRQAELERVVEERRRRLADAAADRGDEQRADDHLALEEAALLVRGPTVSLKENVLPGLDDRAVDVVGHQVDVVDPVRRRRAHVGREAGDPLADAERLRLLGRPVGRDAPQRQFGDARPAAARLAAATAAATRHGSTSRPSCEGAIVTAAPLTTKRALVGALAPRCELRAGRRARAARGRSRARAACRAAGSGAASRASPARACRPLAPRGSARRARRRARAAVSAASAAAGVRSGGS